VQVSSSCSEAPNITTNPSPTDYPDRTTHGREHLLSYVPTSLTDFLYQTFITNFTSMYVRFENVTERVLESQCGDYPEDDDSASFECWQGDRSAIDDVDFLGTDLNTVLLDNPYLQLSPREESFINTFVLSVGWVSSNASTARNFVNSISSNLRMDMQSCAAPVSQMPPTFPPIIPTTRGTIDPIPPSTISPPPSNETSTNNTSGVLPSPTTTPESGSGRRLTAGLLLIPLVLIALIL